METPAIGIHRARVRYLAALADAFDTDSPAAWAAVEVARRDLTAAKGPESK